MKSTLLVVFLIAFPFSGIIAQKKMALGKYTVTVQPLQLLFQDIPVCIERSFKRNTLGVTLGYHFKTHWDEYISGPYYNFNEHWGQVPGSVTSYQALSFGVNAKHYITNRYYFEGQLFYRYWWDNNTGFFPYHINVVNVVGLKCLFGHTSVISGKGSLRVIINKYCGMSFREKFKGKSGNSDFFNEQFGFTPGLQLGVSVGITTFPKDKMIK